MFLLIPDFEMSYSYRKVWKKGWRSSPDNCNHLSIVIVLVCKASYGSGTAYLPANVVLRALCMLKGMRSQIRVGSTVGLIEVNMHRQSYCINHVWIFIFACSKRIAEAMR
ncbi:unnamed protein product [Durusdinium trenchii]|uniref:Uncharacterized protein n=1 Tax=Durusdinium trenchii TaxID=1381693 RepID=A0ABP0MMA5_9DINO